jgi:hypothetical protein
MPAFQSGLYRELIMVVLVGVKCRGMTLVPADESEEMPDETHINNISSDCDGYPWIVSFGT